MKSNKPLINTSLERNKQSETAKLNYIEPSVKEYKPESWQTNCPFVVSSILKRSSAI